jgi:siroheme synthase
MTEPSAIARFLAEPFRCQIVTGILALSALAASLVAAPSAQAQQPAMTKVTLLNQDKGLVDAKPIATKDIVAYIAAQQVARSGLKMIALETCPKVPPDMIQDMMRELQKKKFMVVLDMNEPNARTCAN